MQDLKIALVHELPDRLRLRVPALRGTGLDAAELESWVDVLPGVREARANRAAGSLTVHYDGGSAARALILKRLATFRSTALAPGETTDAGGDAEIAPLATAAFALATLPLIPMPLRRVATFASQGRILAKGADNLVRTGVGVETLDALAIGLAAARGKVYTASIAGLLLALGEYLERRTERQSDRMLRRLLRPRPAAAWLERDGELVQVPGEEVREDEIVVVGPGETVPVDGRAIEGAALVNQSAVTGEEVPVRKEPPHRVLAGSTLVEGRLRIRATQVGQDTTTARVARFIRESLAKGSDTQRLANRLAHQRVYLTLVTGGLVYAFTRDLTRLESVFLVDYSCALKLGTPVAFKSAMAAAADHGVLMKGGQAVEHLAAADTLVFDKTGTLTHSELLVTDVVLLDPQGCDEAGLLALVASVEEHASHPVAQAVVEAARERHLGHITHGEVDYLVAHGLAAEVGERRVRVGSRHYLEEHEGISFADHTEEVARLQEEGKTLLYVGSERGPLGLIALRDTLRADARATIARLRELGIRRVAMMTGDRHAKAEALGQELGLDAVYAEMAPEDKAGLIARLQAEGATVAFVGDGVNDGPALAEARVGIAMPRGADIARATADILLLEDRLSAIAEARDLAGRTMRLIRTNFNLAVGINTAVLAGAITGRLSPIASAVLHNGTTIAILLRALAGAGSDRGKSRATRDQGALN
ncbi:heavy metal translocating P-type ATPase [Thioflavicoccus mobilis 8321]|uniref:P-type Zn(2+) transporter n=1 Tax=Thioflavicoccus mobilis 8321 TaxID=765912 RepID=L0H050_9GAMM|nr:heavy metal translocating P-type ATPase [Thioflavicoccus mobilis]AGA91596.1 heavy metal translocating P-type ATPase [Thioflavicoccus mobilis 8321]